MRKRDADYTLAGIVELDDAFFGILSEGGTWSSTEKTKVLVGTRTSSLCKNGSCTEYQRENPDRFCRETYLTRLYHKQ